MSNNQTQQYTIERLIWGGYGLAKNEDGLRILIKAPVALFAGDVVKVQLQMKRNYAIGNFIDWITKSPEHVLSECESAYYCGGCSFWESGKQYVKLKLEMINDLIYQQQLFRDRQWQWYPASIDNKRCRIQLHYINGELGFHRWKTNDIVDVSVCLMTHRILSDAIPELKQGILNGILPTTIDRWELVCDYPPKNVWVVNPVDPDECWCLVNGSWEKNHVKIEYDLQDKQFKSTPGSFFQAIPDLAEQAFRSIFNRWHLKGSTLYDLYGGCGFFSSLLSSSFTKHVLIESNSMSVADAAENLKGLNSQLISKSVEGWLLKPINDTDAVIILDPPRSGLHERIIEPLRRSKVEHIILIGCDGACFWRDIKKLAPNWQIHDLAVIDLFPNTPHAEFIGLLVKG